MRVKLGYVGALVAVLGFPGCREQSACLRASVEPIRSSFRADEPILMELSLTNACHSSIAVIDPGWTFGTTVCRIKDDEEKFVLPESLEKRSIDVPRHDLPKYQVFLRPGQVLKRRVAINFAFGELAIKLAPGSYSGQCTYYLERDSLYFSGPMRDNLWLGSVASNEVAFQVVGAGIKPGGRQ